MPIRLASMRQPPASLSYFALRRSVGIVAFLLPIIAPLPHLIRYHELLSSISASYYTSTRNFFVGSLCAIGLIMLCTRGYDLEDLIAGFLAGLFAILVAFFPTSPDGATPQQIRIGHFHYAFAATLFLILAYFCLVLFTMTVKGEVPTPQKLHRNIIYYVCGTVILISIGSIGMIALGWLKWPFQTVSFGILFETTSLVFFGIAWTVKGELFMGD
jgi:hypothetical protein